MRILFCDDDIVVCVKPYGVSSQLDSSGKKNMPELLEKQLGGKIFPVHRLDKTTYGIMVFARNAASAARLSNSIRCGEFVKKYLALVHGVPKTTCGDMEDLLFFERRSNKSFIVTRKRKGVKDARLSYRVLDTFNRNNDTVSLVEVSLYTGRTHQIRVQFAAREMPILGDRKYGSTYPQKEISLFSYILEFKHPTTNKKLSYNLTVDELPIKIIPDN